MAKELRLKVDNEGNTIGVIVDEARKVSNALTITQGDTTKTFDGSQPITFDIQNSGGGGGDVTKEAIATVLGLSVAQLDQLSAFAKKVTVSGNNVSVGDTTTLTAGDFDAKK